MSQHRDYLLAHRTRKLNRAVGFAGDVNPTNRRDERANKNSGIYYSGTKIKNIKIKGVPVPVYSLIPFIILFSFMANTILGIVALIIGFISIYVKLRLVLNY